MPRVSHSRYWFVSEWQAGSTGEVLMPDFAKSFGLTGSDIDANWAEADADVMLGREACKEFTSAKATFGLQRCNCVFEFFKICAPFALLLGARMLGGILVPVAAVVLALVQRARRLISSPCRQLPRRAKRLLAVRCWTLRGPGKAPVLRQRRPLLLCLSGPSLPRRYLSQGWSSPLLLCTMMRRTARMRLT